MPQKVRIDTVTSGFVTIRNQEKNLFYFGKPEIIKLTNFHLQIVFLWLLKNADGVEMFFNDWSLEREKSHEFQLLDADSIVIEGMHSNIAASFTCSGGYIIEIMPPLAIPNFLSSSVWNSLA